MDVLRDHRRSDLRHDLVGHRVRCNVKTDVSHGHRLRVVDRHRMDCFCGACLLMVVNLSIHNHDHRVDLSIDPPCYYVDDQNLVVSLCHRMNDRLGDRNLDDDLHDQNLVVNRVNRNYVRRDQKMVVMKGANHDHRMSVMGDRNDLMMVVCHVNRNCVRHDRKTDANLDGNLCRRMSDRLDDRSDLMMVVNLYRHTNVMDDRNDLTMVVSLDVSRGHRMSDLLDDLRMNVTDDRKMNENPVNRSCVRHDLKMDVNLDEMSHRVMYY